MISFDLQKEIVPVLLLQNVLEFGRGPYDPLASIAVETSSVVVGGRVDLELQSLRDVCGAGLEAGVEEHATVILTRDGKVDAVLIDIGGFLGMGERQVALGMEAIRFVSDSATAEDLGDFFLVVNADRTILEAAPEYMRAGATMTSGTTTAAGEMTDGARIVDGYASVVTGSIARAQGRDDAFTDSPRIAYRVEAGTVLATLGYNLAFDERQSLDFSWRFVRSTPTSSPGSTGGVTVRYEVRQLSVSWLMMF